MNRKPLFISTGIFLANLSLFSFSSAFAQSEEAYLKALEAEAEAIASMPLDIDGDVSSDASTEAQSNVDDQYQKQKDEFEKELQKTLPNTYTIYRKLPAEKKAIVVETFYLNDRKMPVASRQIFNFYFNDRKN